MDHWYANVHNRLPQCVSTCEQAHSAAAVAIPYSAVYGLTVMGAGGLINIIYMICYMNILTQLSMSTKGRLIGPLRASDICT